MIFDDYDHWWFMMIYDDLRSMLIDDDFWSMMIYDDWWCFMMIYDLFMFIDDDFWWLWSLMIYDDLLRKPLEDLKQFAGFQGLTLIHEGHKGSTANPHEQIDPIGRVWLYDQDSRPGAEKDW